MQWRALEGKKIHRQSIINPGEKSRKRKQLTSALIRVYVHLFDRCTRWEKLALTQSVRNSSGNKVSRAIPSAYHKREPNAQLCSVTRCPTCTFDLQPRSWSSTSTFLTLHVGYKFSCDIWPLNTSLNQTKYLTCQQ